MLSASSIMLILPVSSLNRFCRCFVSLHPQKRAKYAQGRSITLCLGDSVLRPADYYSFQLFARLGIADAAHSNLFSLLLT